MSGLRQVLTNFLLVLVLLILSPLGSAYVMRDLATAEIPVTDQSNDALQHGLTLALAQSLQKLSGNAAIATLPAMQDALKHASQYMQGYSYQTVEDPANPAQSQLWLQVQFNQDALVDLLKRTGQALWPVDRDQILFCLLTPEAAASNQLLSQDDSFGQTVLRAARQVGLPALLPMGDLPDQQALAAILNSAEPTSAPVLTPSPAPVPAPLSTYSPGSNSNIDPNAAAAGFAWAQPWLNRYGVKDMVFAQLQPPAAGQGQWQAQVKLQYQQMPYSWQLASTSEAQLVQDIVAKVAAVMANNTAVLQDPNLRQTLTVTVIGVADLAEYGRVQRYLQSLSVVNSVTLIGLEQDRVKLQIDSATNTQGFLSAVAKHLVPVANASAATSAPVDANNLVLQWQAGQDHG